MRLSRKILYYGFLLLLTAGFIYTALVCVCTLTRAIHQPYLSAAGLRYDFVGFYLLAFAYGFASVLCLALDVSVIVWRHKHKPVP